MTASLFFVEVQAYITGFKKHLIVALLCFVKQCKILLSFSDSSDIQIEIHIK